MVAPTNEIPLNAVGATIGRPHKTTGMNKQYDGEPHFVINRRAGACSRRMQRIRTKQSGGEPTPIHIVGTGVLDCP